MRGSHSHWRGTLQFRLYFHCSHRAVSTLRPIPKSEIPRSRGWESDLNEINILYIMRNIQDPCFRLHGIYSTDRSCSWPCPGLCPGLRWRASPAPSWPSHFHRLSLRRSAPMSVGCGGQQEHAPQPAVVKVTTVSRRWSEGAREGRAPRAAARQTTACVAAPSRAAFED